MIITNYVDGASLQTQILNASYQTVCYIAKMHFDIINVSLHTVDDICAETVHCHSVGLIYLHT